MNSSTPSWKDNPTWFIDSLTLYQNANNNPESIKRNFLIRIAEFDLIVSDMRAKKKGDPVQHELILGRRGSGKSTLLRRIQIEIDEQADLSEKYIAIYPAEEQNAIYRLSDLWFEVLQELSILLKKPLRLRDFDSFEDNHGYTRYLYDEMHRLLQEDGRRVVLLLDNLDRILENFNDDAHLFRETLINHQDIQIVGGSTRMTEHFWQYDMPFYDFFRRHRLAGLTFEEIHLLLNHWAAEMDLPQLHNYALHHRGRIEAVRILTDGLPRALQYLIQVLLHDSELYGFDYLKKVMDKATPLYQERLNALTPPHRKIVQEMAFIWEAAATKTLVEKCRMESKLISSNLKQLDQYGIVETVQTGKKNHLYRISERFFNMWLIVTQGNPDQKRRAKYLTLFLEGWYDDKELQALAETHLGHLKDKKLSFDKAMVLSKGLAQSKSLTTEQRDQLIDLTVALEPNAAYAKELPRRYREIYVEWEKLIDAELYDVALELVNEIENEEDGYKFFLQAYCFVKIGKEKEAERFYLQSIEKGNIVALSNLANLYKQQGKYAESEQRYHQAIEKGLVTALNNLANLYAGQGKHDEAEQYYLQAIKTGYVDALFNYVDALFNIAILYAEQGKHDKAELYYLQAIEKGNIHALNNLAWLYQEQNIHKQQALTYFKDYLEKSQDTTRTKWLIILEIWNGIFENIPEKVSKVIEADPDEDLSEFFTALLHHGQQQLVLSFFESSEHGIGLRRRYDLLYYAVRILTGRTEDNLLLRIPPEVMPTVEDIVKKVKEKQAFYAN